MCFTEKQESHSMHSMVKSKTANIEIKYVPCGVAAGLFYFK